MLQLHGTDTDTYAVTDTHTHTDNHSHIYTDTTPHHTTPHHTTHSEYSQFVSHPLQSTIKYSWTSIVCMYYLKILSTYAALNIIQSEEKINYYWISACDVTSSCS